MLASIGAAAVPSAGLVVIFIVLEAVNLTGPQVALIVGAMLAIDRPLDMYRTVVNVFSDSCGAAIIARFRGRNGGGYGGRAGLTEPEAVRGSSPQCIVFFQTVVLPSSRRDEAGDDQVPVRCP